MNLLRKSGPLGHLWRRNLLEKAMCLTEKILDTLAARLEHTPEKLLRYLAQDTTFSESSVATATMLHKFRPYKATAVHALQPRVPVKRIKAHSLQSEPPY
jgi:hypothetical protein